MDYSLEFKKRFAGLNNDQQRAVESIEGPVMVVAGPGTGKTEIIGMRVANICLKTGTDPRNILVMTFTESGVRAIKMRLAQIMGPAGYGVVVHTFHGFCAQVIAEFPEKFTFAKRLKRMTEIDVIEILREILDETKPENLTTFGDPYYYVRDIRSSIATLKRENISPERFAVITRQELEVLKLDVDINKKTGKPTGKYQTALARAEKNIDLAQVYQLYTTRCRERGMYDFEDMIMFVVERFEHDEELLAAYQERYLYILVDEYQDTNAAQNAIISLLTSFQADANPNIFVVGDDDQSIYRFQGASLENILFFHTKYHVRTPIVLTQNYRSLQHILDVSKTLIDHNIQRITTHVPEVIKTLVGVRGKGSKIHVVECGHEYTEKYFIANKIQALIDSGVSPSDIAILTAKNETANEFALFLRRNNIPVALTGASNILDHPVVNLFLDCLRIIASPYDDGVLARVMMSSFTETDALDVYKYTVECTERNRIRTGRPMHLWTLFEDQSLAKDLKITSHEAITKFCSEIKRFKELSNSTTFSKFAEHYLKESGFLSWAHTLEDEAEGLRVLSTLFSEIKNLNYSSRDLNLERFLAIITLYQEHDLKLEEEDIALVKDGVRIMTAHKSKGLEFGHVFVVEAVEQVWSRRREVSKIKLPTSVLAQQTSGEHEAIEDERRLFFVALTRAKDQVYITYANTYGTGNSQSEDTPTQFIMEIDPAVIEKTVINDEAISARELLERRTDIDRGQNMISEREYIESLLVDYVMSATHLNTYLECPRKFKYDNLLRIPAVKNKSAALGSAFHSALEDFFRIYKETGAVPSKEVLVNAFESALSREILSKEEYEVCLSEGQTGLSGYYDTYQGTFKVPEALEYDFRPHKIMVGDVPVTGKLDKIERIEPKGSAIRVVDYKTGKIKSDNEIAGLTKNADGNYKRQIVFYKLLCDANPQFKNKFHMTEGVLDFVQGRDGEYKQSLVPFTTEDEQVLQSTIKEVYEKIKKQEFPQTDEVSHCKTCSYYNICYAARTKLSKEASAPEE